MTDEPKEPSGRAITNASKLIANPLTVQRVAEKLSDDELSNLGAVVSQVQSERAIARGDLDEIISQAFEIGFGRDNLALLPWIHENILICPGGLVRKSTSSHVCRFVSINDTWVWDSHELVREDKRSITGTKDGFKAVAIVPATEGLEVDAVSGKARQHQHQMDRAISFEIQEGKLIEVAQRTVRHDH